MGRTRESDADERDQLREGEGQNKTRWRETEQERKERGERCNWEKCLQYF